MADYKITLGGKTFDLPSPFPLGLLRKVEPDLMRYIAMRDVEDAVERTEKTYELSTRILVEVISHSLPSFDGDALNALPMTGNDLVEAVKTAAKACGMFKEQSTGEAQGQMPPNQPSPSNGE